MATSNAQRFLSGPTSDLDLALKMFWGSMLKSYRLQTMLWNSVSGEGGVGENPIGMVVASKAIDSGKSWQFPQFGEDVEAEEHLEGTELLGQQFEIEEGLITIDKPLVSHRVIPMEHIDLSHFSVIADIGASIGRSIANKMDTRLFVTGVKSAQTAAATKNGLTIHNGGNMVERVAATVAAAYPVTATGAQNFRADAATLARIMDEDNVPEAGRFLIITPYIRQVLGFDSTIFNKDFGNMANVLNRRIIGELEGFMVMPPTNNMPSTAITTGPTKYQGDFTAAGSGEGQPVALALCGAQDGSAAIGYVHHGGVRPAIVVNEEKGVLFFKGRLLAGAGVLAPYCAGTIHVDTA